MKSNKTVRKALWMSVLSIALCLTMLIGTTFAWFTDTASTAVNKIQSGTLKVDIQDANGNSLKGKTMSFKNFKGETNILWEPGATFKLDAFKIVNEGNLALKYKVVINGIEGNSKLLEAIDFFVEKDGATAKLEGWDGVLLPDGKTAEGFDSKATSLITISGKMRETAGNDYQGKELNGLGITVLATQYTYENDSTGPDYDAEAQYPSVVTVTPDTIPSPFQANTTYYFEAGEYGERHFVITDQENVTLIGKTGANFDALQISSIDYVNSSIGQKVDLDNSTLTVKGFNVAKTLMIVEADKNVVLEGNTAAQITVKANLSSQSIQVNGNTLTGGTDAANGYGVYIVPNVTDYDLTVTGNTFAGISSHAISVQGCGDGNAVTAAKSITVTGNTFTSYGTNNKDGRAAFKIWEDTKLAPNGTDPLNNAAKALAEGVKANNTFVAGLGSNCVVADFYGKTVAFN